MTKENERKVLLGALERLHDIIQNTNTLTGEEQNRSKKVPRNSSVSPLNVIGEERETSIQRERERERRERERERERER